MTPSDVIREMRDAQWGLSPQVKAWADALEAAMREKDAEIEWLREALQSLRSDLREPAEREGGLFRHFYDRVQAALEGDKP